MPHGCTTEEFGKSYSFFKKAMLAKSRSWKTRFIRMGILGFKSLKRADVFAIGEIAATTKRDFPVAWFYEEVRKQIAILKTQR